MSGGGREEATVAAGDGNSDRVGLMNGGSGGGGGLNEILDVNAKPHKASGVRFRTTALKT